MPEQSKKRIVIIHGAYGSPDVNWFPWLSSELRNRGFRVDVPRLPTPEGQSLLAWRKGFQDQVGEVTPDMVFVGHSLGPAFILRLLASAHAPVAGTFLVAPFMDLLQIEKFDVPNRTFIVGPFDWNLARRNAGFVRIYGSDNDPYVPMARTDEVAKGLGVDVVRIHGGGHLNTAAGFDKFPQLLEDLVAFLNK